ncbi:MAG TPA: hypothetical protein VMM18_03505, partial [Gemmatimonadaceae bacterium]|nr:hypothetical protein [Gemmatimonadaceae bacterium]
RLFRRTDERGRTLLHPERWYDLECPVNPNGLAVLLVTQTVERPSERFPEINVFARPIAGLGTDITLGSERRISRRSEDLSRRLNFHIGLRALWSGVFKVVWENHVRGADLDTQIDQEVVFSALNARAEPIG